MASCVSSESALDGLETRLGSLPCVRADLAAEGVAKESAGRIGAAVKVAAQPDERLAREYGVAVGDVTAEIGEGGIPGVAGPCGEGLATAMDIPLTCC